VDVPAHAWQFVELALSAFGAGLVDAVMGGGGLVQVPVLFAVFPGVAPAALLGTNKIAASFGTGGAAVQYARALRPRWKSALPAIVAALLASMAGAVAISRIPAEPVRLALPFVLLALLLLTVRSSVGETHAPKFAAGHEAAVAAAGAGAIGAYDGFVGPGAGLFYKMLFVRVLGFDFLNAAAPAKLANVASNVGAIIVFAVQGLIIWPLGLALAVMNFLGGQVGSRIALRYGNRLLRGAFLVLISLLIAKTFYDAYLA
jgi:uncharacterized protein